MVESCNSDLLKKNYQEAYREERKWISERRRIAKRPLHGSTVGLALSGGGIRSAAVSRGFIESIDAKGLFSQFDYLSTVSGGSYIGGTITEHIGRLGRRLPLPTKDYPLKAPKSHIPVLVYGLLEALFLSLPLVLYLATLGAIYQGPNSLIVITAAVTAIIVAIVVVVGFSSTFKIAETDKRAWIVAGLVVLTFFALQRFGRMPVIGLLILTFQIAVIYIQRNNHVNIVGIAARIWSYWTAIFFSVCASTLFDIFRLILQPVTPHWIIFSLLILGVGSVYLYTKSVVQVEQWNEFGYASKKYRRNVGDRFLPFSKWPQGRLLYSLKPGPNPFHIINASANSGVTKCHFELSALHCGNMFEGYGVTEDWVPTMTIENAVAVSGGAMDTHAFQFGWASFLSLFVAGTGHWIPRYGDRQKRSSLVWAHVALFLKQDPICAVRLSDGGFVENLGVMPLLYRRVEKIVCLDNGFDPDFDFKDLKKLCRDASRQRVAELTICDPDRHTAALRFSAPNVGFLNATIKYPATDSQDEKVGTMLVIKMHRCVDLVNDAFDGFPHFSTDDQALSEEQLESLYRVGRTLGDRFCDQRDSLNASSIKK